MSVYNKCILLCSIVCLGGRALSQGTLLNTTIIRPASPEFNRLVSQNFRRQVTEFSEGEDQTSFYVLKNLSAKAVFGYVVKWSTISDPLVKPTFAVFDALEQPANRKPPYKGLAIGPYGERLITRFINVSQSDFEEGTPETIGRLMSNQRQRRLESNERYSSEPSLDLIVYEDGTFEGPDEQNLSEQMMLNRQAKHDAGVWVLENDHRGQTRDQIMTALQEQIFANQTSEAKSPKIERYLSLRVRYAQQLLMLDNLLGYECMLKHARQFAALSDLILKRRVANP